MGWVGDNILLEIIRSDIIKIEDYLSAGKIVYEREWDLYISSRRRVRKQIFLQRSKLLIREALERWKLPQMSEANESSSNDAANKIFYVFFLS